jgi:dTDP-glucose pyrophosphorylase
MIDWKKLRLSPDDTILQAMKNLETSGAKFAFVTSSSGSLKGTLTDGDIRRALLGGFDINDKVSKAMNVRPIVASVDLKPSELYDLMKANVIDFVPLIDERGKLIKVLSIKECQSSVPLKDNMVVLMVGGLGSRLGELTANCPKPMLKLGDKPILEIIIEHFKEYGFHNFFLSVNYKSEIIESFFGDGSKHGINIKYIREKERMGTVGSLSLIEPINDLPLIIMNGDVLTKVDFSSLIDFHLSYELDACMCTFRHDYQVPFGVVHFDGDLVVKIEEKPIHSSLVNAGIYSIKPKLLNLIPKETYFDMPVLLEKIIAANYRVGTFQVQDYWLDIGRRDDFHRAEIDYQNKLK